MDWLLIGALVALALALVVEFQAAGKDLLGWAVAILSLAVVVTRWHG